MKAEDKSADLQKGSPNAAPSAARKPARVMLVDDEQLALDVLSSYLSENGFVVSTATSGESAVKRFEAEKAEIVIVDFLMSGMDGLAVIERLSKISPSSVFILMTGFPTLDSSIKALRLGASDYILKPFRLSEVSLAVQKAVREWEFKKEMNRLRERIAELETGVSEKKDNIKFNKKIGAVSGYPPKHISPSHFHNSSSS